jgi:hypothetical protein
MNTHVDLTLSLAADGAALPSLFFSPPTDCGSRAAWPR